MAFTELNSVEHFIIHQLSGVNLNHSVPLIARVYPLARRPL